MSQKLTFGDGNPRGASAAVQIVRSDPCLVTVNPCVAKAKARHVKYSVLLVRDRGEDDGDN